MSTPTLLRAFRPICAVIACVLLAAASTGAEGTVRDRLKSSLFKIAYETYVDGNWEIFAMNADGSQSKNITSTPNGQRALSAGFARWVENGLLG